ncbi:D-amino-acid transaminase [Filomicrobium sp.]|uniref:D-amino-acid transaminase n=1 Tax=Filomicrobium sp. TaxID=2024831 RepID=UPI002590BE89|nr:D-amino-acid transaminase [Filomicrobium sp.]MCV0371548.1 D-amino-acid transaminase [Filomicrobium sp.]
MTRVIYVNGRYLPYHDAKVHVEDRGFQLADAVYEVIEVGDNSLVDATRHLTRLWRSLSELSISPPMSEPALRHVMGQTIRRNRVRNGLVYLQVSRGESPRDFLFPDPPVPPTLVCLARATIPAQVDQRAETGIHIITMPETRWKRCDIKTVMLLPACLAKQQAHAQSASEAWFVDAEGLITEGASSNAWIVDRSGRLLTRPLDNTILPGITRRTVMDTAASLGLVVEESPFTVAEALDAAEAFITSATNTVMPVIMIDGQRISSGTPGPLCRQLRRSFARVAEHSPVGYVPSKLENQAFAP